MLTYIVFRVRVELSQEVSQDQRLECLGADEDVPATAVLEANSILQLLLESECLIELMQLRDEVQDGSEHEHCDQDLPSPVRGRDVTISYCTHSHHQKIVRLKQIVTSVNAEKMMENTCPVGV